MSDAANDGTAIGHSVASCATKRRYPSEAKAWSVIFNMRARGQDTERLNPFRCDHCHDWHLGRRPSSMKSEQVLRYVRGAMRSVLPEEGEA